MITRILVGCALVCGSQILYSIDTITFPESIWIKNILGSENRYNCEAKMRRIQIIVNNGAGTGQAHRIWNETQRLLRGYKIKYVAHTTRYQGHATKLAEKISSMKGDDPIYLIVVGGDGTLNEVLNGITDFDRVRLGVIPTGSGNDFGRNLKLPKSSKESLKQICASIRKDQRGEELYRIDLGQVSWDGCEKPRIFGISSGLGLDALVCKKGTSFQTETGFKPFSSG